MPEHAHEYAKIGVLLAGGLEERCGRDECMPPVCGVVVKPAGVDHADRLSPAGARMFSVRIAAEFLDGLGADRSLFSSYRWIHGGPATRAALILYGAFREHARPEGESFARADGGSVGEGIAPYDLEPALLDLLGSIPGGQQELLPVARPWLTAIRDRIHDEHRHCCSVREMANDAGVHPVHLSRVFRRSYGCTIAEYTRRLRAQEAARMLSATDLPLAAVARDAGFADQPHLTRVFKSHTGLTPLRFRRLCRG